MNLKKPAPVRCAVVTIAVIAVALLPGCASENRPVAEAKKALKAQAAKAPAATPAPDSDTYLERYQSPDKRLERRQQRIREALAKKP